MLIVTEDAVESIKLVVGEDTAGGLRIASTGTMNGSGPGLLLEPAPAPEPDDEILETDGARLFLDPLAVDMLDGKVLDADTEDGGVHFSVREADDEEPLA